MTKIAESLEAVYIYIYIINLTKNYKDIEKSYVF